MDKVRQNTQGSRIRAARLAGGFTQARLAREAGTTERNIIRWENDQHAPRFDHVAAIARVTGKDVSFFSVDEADDEEAAPAVFPGADMLGVLLSELVAKSVRRELDAINKAAA